MVFNNFRITAETHIVDAKCKCGNYAREVSDGLLSSALYCPHCEAVYQLKMVKVPDKKVTEEYLEQCRKEMKRRYGKKQNK